MPLLDGLLHITDFRSPLLRTVVPCVATAFALQGAVAVPSILASSERFFDVSGSLTFLAVGALSLYLPALRARAAAKVGGAAVAAASKSAWSWPSLLAPFRGADGIAAAATGGFNWRHVVVTGMTMVWAARLGVFLFRRILSEGHDSRFDRIRHKPARFAVVFVFQAIWVSLQLLPVMALNAVPAAALPRLATADLLGLSLWASGFALEVVADGQKSRWRRDRELKLHDEEFLTSGLYSLSRFPNYFGEMTLWTGLATAVAGTLATKPAQAALGLSGGPLGVLTTTALSYASPAFVSFLLLKKSGVPLSEGKYDKKYGDRKDYQQWKQNTPMLIPKLW